MSRAREYESYDHWAKDHPEAAEEMRSVVEQQHPHGLPIRSLERRLQEAFAELVLREMIEDGDAFRSEMGAIFLTEQGKAKRDAAKRAGAPWPVS